MVSLPQSPNSDFSRAVFKLIRPHIPRERWPVDTALARFEADPSGLWLKADFDDFPMAYAAKASLLVREAGVDLVIKSPLAQAAAAVVRAKRWRDGTLYAFVPLMFAIPLMATLSDTAMRLAALLFCVNLGALGCFQVALVRKRAALAAERFIAHIPAPGFRFNVPGRSEGALSGGPMPEV